MDSHREYGSFLCALSDEELVLYISQLSEASQRREDFSDYDEFQAQSTQLDKEKESDEKPTSLQSNGTDPFDDGLDDMLAQIEEEDRQETGHLGAEGTALGSKTGAKEDADTDSDLEPNFHGLKSHKFGDFGTYFRNKHIKQQIADKEYVEWEQQRLLQQHGAENDHKKIFAGCIIHVNGHTDPSIDEIHRMVILRGGKFLSYLTKKSAATHIICDKLTPRKSIEFKHRKVVKAKWIVDCVEKNELLDWKEYRVISDVTIDQRRLDQFASSKSAKANLEDHEAANNVSEAFNIEDEIDDSLDLEQDEVVVPKDHEAAQPLNLKLMENGDDHVTNDNPIVASTTELHSIRGMNATHPDFVRHFFAKSRLHHLSRWKAELRLRFLKKIADQKDFPHDREPYATSERIILHVDFDCFFATVSCLNRQDLDIDTDPVAVTHGGQTSDIASCNYIARRQGVKNGMWGSRAMQLCPNLIKLDYDFDAYERTSNEFYNYLINKKIFDHIYPVLIDEVLLDATSFCHANGEQVAETVRALIDDIRTDIKNITHCTVSIGASSNVLLAKLALRHAKPNGAFYLQENIPDFLDSIAVKELPGIGGSIESKLCEILKMDRESSRPMISHLRSLLYEKLVKVFGKKTGMKLFDFARGKDETSISLTPSNTASILSRKSVSVDVNYGIRFENIHEVDRFLMNLAEELHSRLIKLDLCGSRITLRLARRSIDAPVEPPKYLGMGVCDMFSKSSSLGVATNDWGVIGAEMKALYRMLNIPVNELRGVAVTLTNLTGTNEGYARQMKLPFSANTAPKSVDKAQCEEKRLKARQKEEITESKTKTLLEYANIDWNTFQELPIDIRKEITSELKKRGILNLSRDTKKMYDRNKRSSATAGKVFMQQLLPLQTGRPAEYARVVESASSSPRKKRKQDTKVASKIDLDESFIQNLPSLLQDEVMRDLQYQGLNKQLDLSSSPKKSELDSSRARKNAPRITENWLKNQKRFNELPTFLQKFRTLPEIKRSLDDWFSMTLTQNGPHEDDVAIFTTYLDDLINEGHFSIATLLVKHLKVNIDALRCKVNMPNSFSPERSFSEGDALKDWIKSMDKMINPVLNNYASVNNIVLTI